MIDKNNAFTLGFHFAWGALCCVAPMMMIGAVLSALLMPVDDCDKSRWERCGLEVKTDNKTGIQYLVTSAGGIIVRGK